MIFSYTVSVIVYIYQNSTYVLFYLISLGIINLGILILVLYFLLFDEMYAVREMHYK